MLFNFDNATHRRRTRRKARWERATGTGRDSQNHNLKKEKNLKKKKRLQNQTRSFKNQCGECLVRFIER